MSEFKFTPSDITLEAGKPYILELVTTGATKHEFTAPDFFPSVAWRKVESAESEVKATYSKEVEVFPAKQTDLYLIPIEPGTYELLCEIEGHFEAGMFSTIVVQAARRRLRHPRWLRRRRPPRATPASPQSVVTRPPRRR